MNEHKKPLQVAQEFCHYYFEERNCEKLESFLADDVKYFGTADFERASNKTQALAMMKIEFLSAPLSYHVDYITKNEILTENNCGAVFLELNVTSSEGDMLPCRTTFIVREENGQACICAFHASVPVNALGKDDIYSTKNLVDIKALREAQEELDETQKRLWVALQNSNVAVWDYDIKEKCIIQNMNSQDVHGFEKIIKNVPESLIESGYVHPNSVKEFREFYNEILEAKPKITRDILVKNANDTGYWWERMIYIPVFDNDGNHIKSIGTSIDVSYQKNIEEKYQEELAYRENLTDSSLIAFMRVNITKGEIEEHSSKYTAKSMVDGLSYDSAVEMIVENTIDLGEREKMINTFKAEFLQKAYNEGKTEVSVECLRFVKPKRKIWVRCIAKLANLPNSSDIIAFIYTYNIHDEKVLKDIVTHAINKVYDLIMYIDVENQIFTIYREDLSEPTVFLNSDDAAHELAPKNAKIEGAIDSEEVLSKVSLATIQRELENNDAYIFSIKIKDDNGKSSVKRMHYSYLNEQKEVIILIRSDITDVYKQEKIQKEMILQALASAEQANKAKSTFLSSMSHDIRTPMNAIVGMAELASEDIDNKEKVKEYLEVINSSSQHLLALINDVLDMSKIESGAIVLASDRLSLIDEVNNISSMLKNMFDKKEQKFIVKTTNIIHDCLLGDVLRINRIFINLLNNASKFTPNGGEIRFLVEEYPPESDKIAKFKFTVSDSGRGISKDKLSKIFEPFYRDGVSSITRIEGTGLGLSIVKNIVKAKGGNIKVTSEVNKGTTFVVDLPMHIATECNVKKAITHESVVKPHISHDFNGLKVLLVEDHPVNIVVAQKILEKFGAVVEVAENGKIACEKFLNSKDETFNVILMDIQMPIMDGYEATKKIRRSDHTQAKTIPIIAMTANVFAEDVQKALTSGMNAHISKPISIDALSKTFDSLKEKGDLNE